MKRYWSHLIILICLLVFCPFLKAQIFIDGIGLNRSDIQFCEVIEVDYNLFKKRMSIVRETEQSLFVSTNYELENEARQVFIDFGQPIDWKAQQRFQQLNAENLKFNGAIQILNLLVRNGWIYRTRTENYNGKVRTTRYLLERNADFIPTKPLLEFTKESVKLTIILGEKIGYIISKLDGWILPVSKSGQKELTLFLDGYQEQNSPAIIEVQASKMEMDWAIFQKENEKAGFQFVDKKSGVEIYEFKRPEDNVFIQVAYILKGNDLFSFQFSTAELGNFEKYKQSFAQILNTLKDIDATAVFDKN